MGEESSGLDVNNYVIAAFFFVFSYGILFAFGVAHSAIGPIVSGIPVINIFLPLPELNSPMYLLMPVAGFFLMFFLIDWTNKFFNSRQGFSPLLPVLFFMLSLLAFYIAIFWYIGNYAQLSGSALKIEDANNLFATRLKESAYYIFVLSALLGWVSRFALDKIKL